MNDLLKLWESWSNPQKVGVLSFLINKQDKRILLLWEPLSDPQKVGLWELLDDPHKAALWELLPNPHKVGLWGFLPDPQKAALWELLPNPHKVGLWGFLSDPQKVGLWELLLNHQRAYLWKCLPISNKADILEILSRPYSLAHAVFSIKNVIEENEHFKELGFRNVYVSLEESDNTLKSDGDKACVFTRIREYNNSKTLYIKILYETKGGIVEYDANSYISKQCARFLIGHEIAHIILNLDEIIKKSVTSESRKIPMNANEELRADFFAKILSDLRDLHILKRYASIDNVHIPSKEEVANSYKEEMEKMGIDDSDRIIEAVLNLNDESKKFTMSNSIFATKKIMNVIYSEEKRVSLIFPKRGPQDSVSKIECFEPDGGSKGSLGYSIILPNREKARDDLSIEHDCIAKSIGAFLLCYDTIKKESINLPCDIIVDKNTFPFDDLQEFSKCLSLARQNNLKKFSERIKSRERILNI